MELESMVLEYVTKKNKESSGHNGVLLPVLSSELNVPFNDLKPIVNELYFKKKIYVSEGINGKLIFLKT